MKFRSMIDGDEVNSAELIIYGEKGMNSISIEPWQLFAIQQVLGLKIDEDGTHMFTEEFVFQRLKKMGILAER